MSLFGGGSRVELPPVPTFQRNPSLHPAINFGLKRGMDFTNLENLPEGLRQAIQADPAMTQYAIDATKSMLQPSLRDARQNTINQLEANNQLTGSTTASALGNVESDYLSQITSAGLTASMNDVSRAMGARIALSTSGLGAVNNAGQLALGDQGQENEFNLQNYENEVAKVMAGQEPQTGGLMGGLTGGLGGVMGGLALAPFTGGASLLPALAGGLAGGFAGYAGPPGTGGSFLGTGASLQGSKIGRDGLNRLLSKNGESIQFANGSGLGLGLQTGMGGY